MTDEKGIKFYLCQTEEGPQLVHLQADAKKTDPNFETIFIDTSKQPLMERLNDLMRRVHAAEGGSGAAAPRRPTITPGAIGTFAEGNEPAHDHKWMGDDHLVRSGEACNVCLTRKAIADWRASGMAAVEVEELILALTEPAHLANIETMVNERKEQLSSTKGKKQ